MAKGRKCQLPPQLRQGYGGSWPSGGSTRMEQNASTTSSNTSSSSCVDMYFSREEIDRCSPSRRDGIDVLEETFLRHSYCSFIQTLGMRLQLPQTTIATAMVLCHRFFLRRSHATYDRFIIATSCLFLAAKSEETARPLNSVLLVSYEMCHRHELANFHYRMPEDWFEQYKELVLEAEQLVLTTLDFELTVQHPYKPLMTVLNKIGLAQTALVDVAWNLLNDGRGCTRRTSYALSATCGKEVAGPIIFQDLGTCGLLIFFDFKLHSELGRLRSSLALQYKPHHIAAGAAFLAAQVLNIDMASNANFSWWQEFQTTPAILDNVTRQMLELYGSS